MPADLIIIAAIAIFILLRLRSILGDKNGNEEDSTSKLRDFLENIEEKDAKVVTIYPKKEGDSDDNSKEEATAKDEALEALSPELQEKIKDIHAIDANFKVDEFLSGAKIAFEMIFDAFKQGDKPTLKNLLAKEVYHDFSDAITDRSSSNETDELTLVSINSATIEDASAKRSNASITVKFISEQMRITKDEDGKVISSEPSEIDEIEDIWTFERDLKSANPNWRVTET